MTILFKPTVNFKVDTIYNKDERILILKVLLNEKELIIVNIYSTNHVYLHRPNAFGFWQLRLHLCYETLKRISNFSELA